MPLRSEFFRGDTRLEGAASRDSAHILPNTRGPHVEKIQLALMLLDDAEIAPEELDADLYGPSTAAAVLAYKRRRRIVNPRYQTMPDNIVGRMTMASLDNEMFGRQVSLKRCGCTYLPAGSSEPHKRHFFAFAVPEDSIGGAGGGSGGGSTRGGGSTGTGGGSAKQVTGAAPGTLALALAAVPAANGMRERARDVLNAVIDGSGSAADRTLGLAALTRHYKVTAGPDIDRVARQVRNNLAQVASRLLSARAWLRQGTSGGFADTPTPRDGHTYINLDYGVAQRFLRPTILIHEAFHDIADVHQDFGGNPVNDRGARYHLNDTATQLVNAYAMSQFVLHLNIGQEIFLNDSD